ncbi:unnamed protein product [Periconia digitata]|uniref:Uncharacterized protein n=1 Tax=Periconia digitata TaxID=1303443 RepID=A0A9W4XSP8_9PLEO|nr:unnamed protein product [Periconia digitata]
MEGGVYEQLERRQRKEIAFQDPFSEVASGPGATSSIEPLLDALVQYYFMAAGFLESTENGSLKGNLRKACKNISKNTTRYNKARQRGMPNQQDITGDRNTYATRRSTGSIPSATQAKPKTTEGNVNRTRRARARKNPSYREVSISDSGVDSSEEGENNSTEDDAEPSEGGSEREEGGSVRHSKRKSSGRKRKTPAKRVKSSRSFHFSGDLRTVHDEYHSYISEYMAQEIASAVGKEKKEKEEKEEEVKGLTSEVTAVRSQKHEMDAQTARIQELEAQADRDKATIERAMLEKSHETSRANRAEAQVARYKEKWASIQAMNMDDEG